MRRIVLTALLGLLLFVLLVLYKLPAHYVTTYLPPAVQLQGVQGTVWQGKAALLMVQGQAVGAVRWSWCPADLLGVGWGYHVAITSDAINGTVNAAYGPGDKVRLKDLNLGLRAAWLHDYLPNRNNIDLLGNIQIFVQHLLIQNGWPMEGNAVVEWQQAALGGDLPMFLGDLVADVVIVGDELIADIADNGGPLELKGQVSLSRAYEYGVDLSLRARADAEDNLVTSLGLVSAPDTTGRYHFNRKGRL